MSLKPSNICFTQDSISPVFQNGYSVNGSIEEIKKGLLSPHDFPFIRVFRFSNGKIFSLDNRRLYVFRVCEYLGILSKITVKVATKITDSERRKFTTKNGGLEIRVRRVVTHRHYQDGWLVKKPLEVEASTPRGSIHGSRPSSAAITDASRKPSKVSTVSRIGQTPRNPTITTTRGSTVVQRSSRNVTTYERSPLVNKVKDDKVPTLAALSISDRTHYPAYTRVIQVKDSFEEEMKQALEYSKNLTNRETPGLPIDFYDEERTIVSSDEDEDYTPIYCRQHRTSTRFDLI